jgi:hypothetical protein
LRRKKKACPLESSRSTHSKVSSSLLILALWFEDFSLCCEFCFPLADDPSVAEIRKLVDTTRVTVDTVDSFQGHERDIIVISTVRSAGRSELCSLFFVHTALISPRLRVGFLSDERRWNVAITRAKVFFLPLPLNALSLVPSS